METHVRVLGVLHIVLGAIGALVGLGFLLFFGGLATFVGSSPNTSPHDAQVAVPVLTLIGGGLCILLLVLSLPGIIAGVGLLNFRPWARILGIVLSAIQLVNVPVGTAIGVYGLWVLLAAESEPLFHRHPVRSHY